MKIDEEIKKFNQKVKAWSKKLKVYPLACRLDRIKQWGFCSSNGIVYFNSDLLFKRQELQTYVIVHELLHLKIPNHGKLFQAWMNIYVPNWKTLDKELNLIKQEERFTDSQLNLPT